MGTGTEEYYRVRAGEFDRVYEKPERQSDLGRLRRWLPNVLADHQVLEVAAGTGNWTDVYADRVAAATATDLNPSTLEVARARRTWPAHVQFLERDAFDLHGLAGRFDAAFVGFFWSHVLLQDLDTFLSGLTDRLDEGATVVFMDNRFVEGSNHPVTRRDAEGNTYQRRELADGSTWEVLKNFHTVAELRSRLEPIASRVELDDLTYYWTAVCTSAAPAR